MAKTQNSQNILKKCQSSADRETGAEALLNEAKPALFLH
jgi:hypothetical protein